MSAVQIRSAIESVCRRLGLRLQAETVYEEIWKLSLADIAGIPEITMTMPEDNVLLMSFAGLKGSLIFTEEEEDEDDVSLEQDIVSTISGLAAGTIRVHYSEGMFGTTLRLAEKTQDGWEMGQLSWTMRFHPWPTFRPTIYQATSKAT